MPFWGQVYRAAFGCTAERYVGDRRQAGVDRLLTLADGRDLKVEEKYREPDKRYADFALETWSDLEHGAPGWIAKDAPTDVLAYAFGHWECCYLLPWPTLRAAWVSNGARWTRLAAAGEPEPGEVGHGRFSFADSPNPGKTTRSVCVPICLLLRELPHWVLVDYGGDRPPRVWRT
jgi:hypothetical protein